MKNSISYLIIFLLLLLFQTACVESKWYQVDKSATSMKGMVVTAHPLASEAGAEILRKGGNAADASIAVQLVLAVVYPRAGNIGGGGFLTYRNDKGEIYSLDFREKASAYASSDMYLDSAGNIIPGLLREGILAIGVPGTVAGLVETHKKFGKLQWSDLFEPAIRLAKNGFKISTAEAERLNGLKEIFLKYNDASMPFISESTWQEGDLLVQPDLAKTLQLIADKGRDGFYEGENAKVFLKTVTIHNGIITQSDLSSYQTAWRTPITIQWRDFEIHTMSLPSSGGIVLGQILKMIDGKLIDSLGNRHPHNVHL